MERIVEFAAELRRSPGVAVLAVRGELDPAIVGRFRRALDEACQPRPPLLVVDLDGVPFLCSASLGALVVARTEALAQGTRIVVAGARPAVMRVFKVTSLAAAFDVQPRGAPWPWRPRRAGRSSGRPVPGGPRSGR